MAIESPRPFRLPLAPVTALPEVPRAPASPRVPTGIPDFDFLTGGLPVGSVVLLIGEPGAGHQEFALTSAVHLMLHYDDPRLHQFFLGTAKGPFSYPKAVTYISVTRSQEQVLQEVGGSFVGSYPDVLRRHVKFHDLSPTYFADSVVPPTWSSVRSPLLLGTGAKRGANGTDPLKSLADAMEEDGQDNLLIVDSLTDLLVRSGVESDGLLTLLKGLRRRAKEWGGVVYLLLSRGVAPLAVEQALIDSVDGVLSFSWTTSPSHSHRQRVMLIEKFMSVLSRVPHEHQGRFVIRISALSGLVTTQYERI
jgi:KaiC/GvpD/RAD55 family RecA-like ATPase